MDDSMQIKRMREDLDSITEKLDALRIIERRVKSMAEWIMVIGIVTVGFVGLSFCVAIVYYFELSSTNLP